jgi:hypothetical protein
MDLERMHERSDGGEFVNKGPQAPASLIALIYTDTP